MKRFAVALALACLGGAALAPAATADGPMFPTTINLPAGFRPEGIEIGPLPVAYFGSRADGSIFRVDLMTGRGALLSPGAGTESLGLELDDHGRLFVASGAGGDARVLDACSGAVLATYRLGTPPDTFVNDVTVTPTGAWFTDSRSPVLYRLPLDPGGALPATVERVPLSGDIDYVPEAFNANGIARTPDGTGLIIVQSVTGRLFRVDPATGATQRIDLGTETVPDGDGLLLRDHTLFVVQNRSNTIAVIALDDAGTKGTVAQRITDQRFDTPTTVAEFGDRLYVPNARYTTTPVPTTSYNVVAIEQPR
ncbi:superoxide dismutase [Nocardia sp. SYP-A9097]|uniref:SMP-30/gluconolactonase/LRE family protein n=1 Tax=Nocardia sp. SYP-A9097 TaxID=2663237 RepID=UPI00129BD760|nr:SMP-30/gluconolactonase/LRE family protein [Nocardia sp. SYP-A9097]MRH90249.1 superoxide dismutase [Nocardia sp. SYP-A9097]